jgi:hypothetical protein
MKTLMILTLILLGGVWLFCASAVPMAMRTRAMSDAMQLESNLKGWATEKVSEGKLDESDLQDLFPEGYSLRFGGEHPSRNFREMIDHIAVSSAPPAWPGLFMIAIGIIGGIHSIYNAQTKKQNKSCEATGDNVSS